MQFFSLLVLHSSWGPEFKWFCNPVLSCHSCALSWFACPIGVLVHYSGYHVFPFLAVGILLLLGVLFGRLLCGWVCPFGLLQDLLYKIPGSKFSLPHWTGRIKYLVLLLLVIIVPFACGEQTAYSFCRICPAAALQVTIPGLVSTGAGQVQASTVVKLSILAAVLLLTALSSRAFCKTMCPIGAMLAPLNFISLWRVRTPTGNCTSCKLCDDACPTENSPSLRISRGQAPNRSPGCVVCHDCQSVCPKT